MRRVAVIFTGGTISMRHDPVLGGNVPSLDGAGILAQTPGLDAIAEVRPIDMGRTPASHFSFAQLFEIGVAIRAAQADQEIDGVVVVQGTDVLEETAFFWDLILDSPKPVVVTGAMRSASEPGYEGPQNLRDAVRAAAADAFSGAGVIVCMAGISPTGRAAPRWRGCGGATRVSAFYRGAESGNRRMAQELLREDFLDHVAGHVR